MEPLTQPLILQMKTCSPEMVRHFLDAAQQGKTRTHLLLPASALPSQHIQGSGQEGRQGSKRGWGPEPTQTCIMAPD